MTAPTTPPDVTTPPAAPSRTQSPDDFTVSADAFVAWLSLFVTQLLALISWFYDTAAAAYASAVAAAASAATATEQAVIAMAQAVNSAASAATSQSFATSVVNTANSIGTSVSSNAFGTGAKTFATQTGKSWVPGMYVAIALTSDPSKFMVGYVTSYNSGTGSLVVNVVYENHSGTFATWNIFGTAPVDLVNILEPRSVTAATTFAAADDVNFYTSGASIPQPLLAPVPGAQLILHHMVGGSNTLKIAPASGVTVVGPNKTLANPDDLEVYQGETLCLSYKATNVWEIR